MRKRTELGGVFAALAGQHLQMALQRDETPPRITAVAHFVVGGVSQAINAWLTGSIAFGQEELIDQLTTLLDGFVDPPAVLSEPPTPPDRGDTSFTRCIHRSPDRSDV